MNNHSDNHYLSEWKFALAEIEETETLLGRGAFGEVRCFVFS